MGQNEGKTREKDYGQLYSAIHAHSIVSGPARAPQRPPTSSRGSYRLGKVELAKADPARLSKYYSRVW